MNNSISYLAQEEAAALLIRNGANVSITNFYSHLENSPLHIAVYFGNVTFIYNYSCLFDLLEKYCFSKHFVNSIFFIQETKI